MTFKPSRLIRLAEFGIWQFFVLTIIAMVIFPGGTLHDPSLDSYSFLKNFFSDLGRTLDFEGNTNPSRWVFTTTVSMVGISMMGFFIAMPSIFNHDVRFNRSRWIAVFFGMIAGLCYIGVGFTPYDILLPGHEVSVKLGFSAFLVASVIMTWMIYKSRYYPNVYGHIFIVFDVILFGYIIMIFYGPDARATESGMIIQVVSQKIVIYSEIICMVIQMRGARLILARSNAGN